MLQEKVGKAFGFDASVIERVKNNSGVYIMPEFSFAHLVFDESNPEKILYFLKRIKSKLNSPLVDGAIPHTLSQGKNGILVAPTKIDVGRSMGSERAPGYFFVPTQEDFDKTTYESAMQFMQERFYPREIGLEKFI